MKLVVLFMLVTIPVYCYASGSGCETLDDIISQTISSNVSVDEYLELLKPYVHDPFTAKAVKEFKQCFLNQDEETLKNAGVMVQAIYDSEGCQESSS